MKEIDPEQTGRAQAFRMWLGAPMPMLTFFKSLNVKKAFGFAARNRLKFNMLMLWLTGMAARNIREFYMLPVGDKLFLYESLAIGTIIINRKGGINSCDIPFSEDLREFSGAYQDLCGACARNCEDHACPDRMAIGTSNMARYDIDGAVNIYSGIYNNPFLIWGRARKNLFRTTLAISFQFHHSQMDGEHAAKFLQALQAGIDGL